MRRLPVMKIDITAVAQNRATIWTTNMDYGAIRISD